MTDTRPHKTPGPDHPITLERSPSHVVVQSGTAMIAETDRLAITTTVSESTVQ